MQLNAHRFRGKHTDTEQGGNPKPNCRFNFECLTLISCTLFAADFLGLSFGAHCSNQRLITL